MNVTCPNCATIYRVDPRKVPEGGIRARCAVCSAIFAVGNVPATGTMTADAASASVPAPAAPPARFETVPAAAAEPWEPTPSMAPEPKAEPAPEPVAPPAAEAVATAPHPDLPRPAVAPPAQPVHPGVPPAIPHRPMAPRPAVARPAGMPPRPAGVAPQRSPEPTPRRPVNPFLSQDPSQKARRLARALISDMVVYHPAKRREGLRDGNLKTLFDEEIKKSWEEYTDQVGTDIAEGTTHFRDALNEILADGRQIF